MHEIEYIQAGEEHIGLLIDARIEFFLALTGPQTDDAIAELKLNMKDYLQVALPEGLYVGILAMSGKEIAGAGGMAVRQRPGNFMNPTGIEAYIMSMYTAPAHRRKGIATTILNKLVALATDRGIKVIELHATKDGEPVYRQNGFKDHIEPTLRLYPGKR